MNDKTTTELTTTQRDIEADFGISARGMSPALQIMLHDRLFERCKLIAKYLSEAQGFTPPHLINAPQACFAVVVNAIVWKLNPYAVAWCTYQTPGGRVGYEGKLVQAILENSGHLVGPVKYKLYGDWSRVKGKFELKTSQKGKEYPVLTWTREDAKGLGVTVSAQIRGEVEERTLDYDLDEAFPLNSTLWATKPHQQIKYTACRAFANTCAPGLLLGVPFEGDGESDPFGMIDVTPPRPLREEYLERAKQASAAAAAPPVQPPSDADLREADRMMERARAGEPATAQTPEAPEALAIVIAKKADGKTPDIDGYYATLGALIDMAPDLDALERLLVIEAENMRQLRQGQASAVAIKVQQRRNALAEPPVSP